MAIWEAAKTLYLGVRICLVCPLPQCVLYVVVYQCTRAIRALVQIEGPNVGCIDWLNIMLQLPIILYLLPNNDGNHKLLSPLQDYKLARNMILARSIL